MTRTGMPDGAVWKPHNWRRDLIRTDRVAQRGAPPPLIVVSRCSGRRRT